MIVALSPSGTALHPQNPNAVAMKQLKFFKSGRTRPSSISARDRNVVSAFSGCLFSVRKGQSTRSGPCKGTALVAQLTSTQRPTHGFTAAQANKPTVAIIKINTTASSFVESRSVEIGYRVSVCSPYLQNLYWPSQLFVGTTHGSMS